MYIERSRTYYESDGSQRASQANFLILMNKRSDREAPVRAIVRKVALSQLGHFMMGFARIKGVLVTVSGPYGGDGLPTDVDDEVYEEGVVLPDHIYDAWNSNNDKLVEEWARENIQQLVSKHQRVKMIRDQKKKELRDQAIREYKERRALQDAEKAEKQA